MSLKNQLRMETMSSNILYKDMNHQVEEKDREIERLEEEKAQLRERMKENKQMLKVKDKEISNLTSSIAKLTAQRQEKNTRIFLKAILISNLKKTNEELVDQLAEKDEELREKTAKLSSKIRMEISLKLKLSSVRSHLYRANAQNEELEAANKRLVMENEILKARNTRNEELIEKQRSEISSKNNEIRSKNYEIESLSNDLSTLFNLPPGSPSSDVDEFVGHYVSLRESQKMWFGNYGTLFLANSNLKNKLDFSQRTLASLTSRYNLLEYKYQRSREDISRYQEEIFGLDDKFEVQETQISSLKSLIKKLKRKLEKVENLPAQLEGEGMKREELIVRFCGVIERLEGEITSLERCVISLRREKRRLEFETKYQRLHLQNFTSEITSRQFLITHVVKKLEGISDDISTNFSNDEVNVQDQMNFYFMRRKSHFQNSTTIGDLSESLQLQVASLEMGKSRRQSSHRLQKWVDCFEVFSNLSFLDTSISEMLHKHKKLKFEVSKRVSEVEELKEEIQSMEKSHLSQISSIHSINNKKVAGLRDLLEEGKGENQLMNETIWMMNEDLLVVRNREEESRNQTDDILKKGKEEEEMIGLENYCMAIEDISSKTSINSIKPSIHQSTQTDPKLLPRSDISTQTKTKMVRDKDSQTLMDDLREGGGVEWSSEVSVQTMISEMVEREIQTETKSNSGLSISEPTISSLLFENGGKTTKSTQTDSVSPERRDSSGINQLEFQYSVVVSPKKESKEVKDDNEGFESSSSNPLTLPNLHNNNKKKSRGRSKSISEIVHQHHLLLRHSPTRDPSSGSFKSEELQEIEEEEEEEEEVEVIADFDMESLSKSSESKKEEEEEEEEEWISDHEEESFFDPMSKFSPLPIQPSRPPPSSKPQRRQFVREIGGGRGGGEAKKKEEKKIRTNAMIDKMVEKRRANAVSEADSASDQSSLLSYERNKRHHRDEKKKKRVATGKRPKSTVRQKKKNEKKEDLKFDDLVTGWT